MSKQQITKIQVPNRYIVDMQIVLNLVFYNHLKHPFDGSDVVHVLLNHKIAHMVNTDDEASTDKILLDIVGYRHLKDTHDELRAVLKKLGTKLGGFEGYIIVMHILLNSAFERKLKKPLSKRSVMKLMLMAHETALIVTGKNEANDVNILLDIASNSLLKAESEKVQRKANV